MWKLVALVVVIVGSAEAYRTVSTVRRAQIRGRCRAAMDGAEEEPERDVRPPPPKLNFFQKLMQGLDDVVDDALDRKLGNGANFYGKRKSNFYGQEDELKKKDPRVANAEEDYRGNKGGSYFVWDKELDAPLTKKQARLKKAGKLVLDEDES